MDRQNRLLLIVGVCLAIAVSSCKRPPSNEQWGHDQFQTDVKDLHISLDLFAKDCGRYPTMEEGLAVLITDPGISGWRGPYRDPADRPDPWNTPYRYTLVGEKPKITSAGKDKQFGTADDLSN